MICQTNQLKAMICQINQLKAQAVLLVDLSDRSSPRLDTDGKCESKLATRADTDVKCDTVGVSKAPEAARIW